MLGIARVADDVAEVLIACMVADLACSGDYSGGLDAEYAGQFWDLVEQVEKLTGRDLEKEARRFHS